MNLTTKKETEASTTFFSKFFASDEKWREDNPFLHSLLTMLAVVLISLALISVSTTAILVCAALLDHGIFFTLSGVLGGINISPFTVTTAGRIYYEGDLSPIIHFLSVSIPCFVFLASVYTAKARRSTAIISLSIACLSVSAILLYTLLTKQNTDCALFHTVGLKTLELIIFVDPAGQVTVYEGRLSFDNWLFLCLFPGITYTLGTFAWLKKLITNINS